MDFAAIKSKARELFRETLFISHISSETEPDPETYRSAEPAFRCQSGSVFLRSPHFRRASITPSTWRKRWSRDCR